VQHLLQRARRCVGELRQGQRPKFGCVVHQDVDAVEPFQRGCGEAFDIGRGRDVGEHRQHVDVETATFLGNGFERRAAAGAECKRRAFAGCGQRECPAEAP
jgi:hypothetical protein